MSPRARAPSCQRMEMGEREIFLDGLTREQALALARDARQGPVVPSRSHRRRAQRGRAEPRATPRRSWPRRPALRDAAGPARRPTRSCATEALSCTRCRLAETRTQVVFSDGSVDARLVVVGEAPGANEDATGLPFVGAAGKFLDLLLAHRRPVARRLGLHLQRAQVSAPGEPESAAGRDRGLLSVPPEADRADRPGGPAGGRLVRGTAAHGARRLGARKAPRRGAFLSGRAPDLSPTTRPRCLGTPSGRGRSGTTSSCSATIMDGA